VFTIEQPPAKPTQMPYSDAYELSDPDLVKAARDIYSFYCQINPDRERRRQPIGVAMNKLSHHGKLIFSSYPILLPEEDFISVAELEN
jgi:hypothetical protein